MRRIAMGLAISMIVVSCGSTDDPVLSGVWSGIEVDGEAGRWTFTFSTAETSVTFEGMELYTGTHEAVPPADPTRLDTRITDSVFPQYIGDVTHGIYRIDGTKLTLASNEPGIGDVPAGFVANGETRVWELTKE